MKKNKKPLFSALFNKRALKTERNLNTLRIAQSYLEKDITCRPSVLVGGTNGKGGTAGYLWHSLRRASIHTGLFTSPHLINFNERFVTEDIVKDPEIYHCIQRLKAKIPEDVYEQLSFFDISTLIALEVFKQGQTEIDIFEVGIGGRLDATNTITPVASAIVSIGLDHQEYLGKSITSITSEKLGILRPCQPLFIGSIQYSSALEQIRVKAKESKSPLFELGKDFWIQGNRLSVHLEGYRPLSINIPRFLSHAPRYVIENFLLATSIHHWLEEEGYVNGSPLSTIADLAHPLPSCVTGRFQQVSATFNCKQINILFDVCHNPDGVKKFKESLDSLLPENSTLPGLVCFLGDKDSSTMLDILKSFLKPLVLFKIESDRCFSGAELAGRHADLQVTASIADALELMEARNALCSGPLVICGSVLAVGKVLEYFSCTPMELSSQLSQGGYSQLNAMHFQPYSGL